MKRKLPALLCALALILSLAGCVISTPDTVGTIGDVEITSGLYLLAQYNAYQSAANLASSDQDAANVKSFLKETITTDPDSFNDVVKALEEKGYSFESAEIEMVPQNYIVMTSEDDVRSMTKLLDMLDDNEDVQNVWHNWQQD